MDDPAFFLKYTLNSVTVNLNDSVLYREQNECIVLYYSD